MPVYQKIPLLPETTDQTLSVEIGGGVFNLRVLWNERGGYFSLSIATANDTPILTNVKMVKNYPLFGLHKGPLLPFGDMFFVQESGNADRPGYDDLGAAFALYYYEPDIAVPVAPALDEPVGAVIGSLWDASYSAWDSSGSAWDM